MSISNGYCRSGSVSTGVEHREDSMLQLNEHLLLGLRPGKLFFLPALSNLTQRPSDMGESQHESPIKIWKAQTSVKLC